MDPKSRISVPGNAPQVLYNVELCDSDRKTILFLSGVTILKVSAMMEVMSEGQQVIITLYSGQ